MREQRTRHESTQNAHEFEHGCSYAVKHKEVRERPHRTLRFFVDSCLVLCSLNLRGDEIEKLQGASTAMLGVCLVLLILAIRAQRSKILC